MIALITTYFLVFYVLIPGVAFRIAASPGVRLRLFQLSKTQEAAFAVLVAILPFVAAYCTVWHVPVGRTFPAPTFGSVSDRRADYHKLAEIVLSADGAKLLADEAPTSDAKLPTSHGSEQLTAGARSNSKAYWDAIRRVERRQARFLSWFYLFTLLEGAVFGFLMFRHGDISRFKPYAKFASKFLLPRISEWQLLLTPFVFPSSPRRLVYADVLCTNDTIYRGRVVDYFLALDGSLSGIQLKEVGRFQKAEYDEAKNAHKGPFNPVARGDFWREIPSANFYVPASQIVNLNVRFVREDLRDQEDLRNYVEGLLNDESIEVQISGK